MNNSRGLPRTQLRGFISLGLILLLVIGLVVLGGAGWYVSQNGMKAFDTLILTSSPTSGTAPLTVNFSVQATDSTANSGIYYTIVFGDDEADGFSRSANPTLSHTYTVPGIYTATLTRRTKCGSWECIGPSSVLGTATITVK